MDHTAKRYKDIRKIASAMNLLRLSQISAPAVYRMGCIFQMDAASGAMRDCRPGATITAARTVKEAQDE